MNPSLKLIEFLSNIIIFINSKLIPNSENCFQDVYLYTLKESYPVESDFKLIQGC